MFILGGGSPKNFVLQTEPQIQEVMGVAEKGHDYFLQVTDARPDTGGLSGATPSEAVSWGKIDPNRLPDSVVCYVDSTVALPLITAYALARRKPRRLRRLYDEREAMMTRLPHRLRACAAQAPAPWRVVSRRDEALMKKTTSDHAHRGSARAEAAGRRARARA